MRSQVSAIGRFQCDSASRSGVEVLIDHLGEIPPEAPDPYEVVDARTQYPLQAAELPQQLAPFDRTQARNGLEYRLTMPFRPLAPVSRDRKAMRLVAHPLDHVQSGRIRRQDHGRFPVREVELLLPGPPVGTLGDPDQGDAHD